MPLAAIPRNTLESREGFIDHLAAADGHCHEGDEGVGGRMSHAPA
ncbi:MAG TPA: hypothetical protein VEU07_16400 [Candidatus Acidoferrum sp.]|nr:hypothetical protein [Candidatus Acidoferrum sp.]